MKIGELPQGIKASLAFFLASIITKGVAYITTPLYTNLLTAYEYGKVAVFLTWLEIFGIVAMFCLSYGVFNNGMIDYPKERDDYSFSMLILSNCITVIFSFIILLLHQEMTVLLRLDFKYILLMIIVFFSQPAYNFWVSRQRYELKYGMVAFWSIALAIFSSAVPVLMLFFCDIDHLTSRLFGCYLVLIFFYTGFYIYLGCKAKWKINIKYWKNAILFNLPLIPHYLSTYLLGSSDKIMISYFVGEDATAYYSVAYSVAAIALIVWTSINSSLIPFTYEKCQNKDYSAINKVTLPLLYFFAVACVFVIMVAPEVVKIMATDEYVQAIYAIPPIVGGVFFQVQYYIYANIVYYYKKPKYVMIASVLATISNIILNYVFIRKFGYIAAGYTTLICYMIQAMIDYFAMRRVVTEKVYDMKKIVCLSLIVISIAMISNVLYKLVICRYLILCLLIGVLIKFRKNIVEMIKLIKEK